MSRSMPNRNFHMQVFEGKIEKALETVQRTLDENRKPRLPWGGDAVAHAYDDKYDIAQLVSKTTLASNLNALSDGIGLTADALREMEKSRLGQRVTLRFDLATECAFKETKKRDVQLGNRVEKTSSLWGKTTIKEVQTVYDHYWNYGVSWKFTVYAGTDVENGTVILSRTGTRTIVTHANSPERNASMQPFASNSVNDPQEVDITWLMHAIDFAPGEIKLKFKIDRSDPEKCKTPRRNEQIDELLENEVNLVKFAQWQVKTALKKATTDVYTTYPPAEDAKKVTSISGVDVFCPVSAMLCMEEFADGSSGAAFTNDFNRILGQQSASIRERFDKMSKTLPHGNDAVGVLTAAEARVVVTLDYIGVVADHFSESITAIEKMLMNQLVSAIGKEIGPNDFSKYMEFHNRNLFLPQYRPKGFCYAIRRPDHYPEGTLSIENSDNAPIYTTVQHRKNGHAMKFPLSAAVDVPFHGEHYVHAHVFHKFSCQNMFSGFKEQLTMIARARQFSSFIILVGSLSSADTFLPESAMIVQNKDEIAIPLMMETIPTPKEFRDAIESLSPEQKAFCQAYRKMQLAGTLFGVCIVQIKPQLEKLLNLPHDGLTKEVQMCQDLMSLFIEFQIPSDLLAYDGDANAPSEEKIEAVKGHIAAIMKMIDEERQRSSRQKRRELQSSMQRNLL